MKELVERIIKEIVDNPDKVQVEEIKGEMTTILEVSVAPSDMGKVIGREGRTAKAIRTILNAAGMRINRRIEYEIIDTEDAKK